MVNVKKVNFEFDEELEKGIVGITFEITGIERLEKEVLKWQLREFDAIFEGQHYFEIECSKFVKSENISDLIMEIEEYVTEKKKKIEEVLKSALELKRFLNNISIEEEAE